MSFITEEEEKAIQDLLDKEFPECKGMPKWVMWYYRNWIKPFVEKLDSEWYNRSERQKDKLVDIAHEDIMSNHFNEVIESMPQHLREDMEQWEQTEMPKLPKSPMQQYLEEHDVKCPKCGSADIRSFGKFQWQCNQCARRFKKDKPQLFR